MEPNAPMQPIENSVQPVENKPQTVKKDSWWDTLKYAGIALLIVIPIRLFIAEPFIVSGASMDPTFETGEYIIIDEVSYRLGTPHRGDVVVFKPPVNLDTYYIKRVIGLPGETVSIDAGIVTIITVDKKKITLKEPYLINKDRQDMPPVSLESDEYFVLGDNRPVSSDSRVWGPLPEENIVGTPFVSLFPFRKIAISPGTHDFSN